jgi:hypothetical protein
MGDLFSEYASVQAQIEALELKKSQLRPHIIEMMAARGEEKVETGLGSFSVFPKKTWTYPESIKPLEDAAAAAADALKAAKAKAESTGEATFEEAPQLRFTPVKL